MAGIVIRRHDDDLNTQLRLRAAANGHSMEAEARELLKSGLCSGKPAGREFLASIRALVGPFGGVELEPYRRAPRSLCSTGDAPQMIVLDTNVLSDSAARACARSNSMVRVRSPEKLYVTTSAQAGILYGTEILPDGRRNTALRESFLPLFEQFAGGARFR